MDRLLKIAKRLGLTTRELCEDIYYIGLASGRGCILGRTPSGTLLYGLASPAGWRMRTNKGWLSEADFSTTLLGRVCCHEEFQNHWHSADDKTETLH